jgi:hypothetical protein
MQLRIWSALDGDCPVVMSGHRRRITDVAMIARGRNVLCKVISGFDNGGQALNS